MERNFEITMRMPIEVKPGETVSETLDNNERLNDLLIKYRVEGWEIVKQVIK